VPQKWKNYRKFEFYFVKKYGQNRFAIFFKISIILRHIHIHDRKTIFIFFLEYDFSRIFALILRHSRIFVFVQENGVMSPGGLGTRQKIHDLIIIF